MEKQPSWSKKKIYSILNLYVFIVIILSAVFKLIFSHSQMIYGYDWFDFSKIPLCCYST